MDRAPVVSVVTPFYNTAAYLAECVESVLAQTCGDLEYLLVDNKSTDASREIAARYAAKDSRIRLLDNEAFVGQVENYNGALSRIDGRSKYVKIVQADDAVFPDCLALMVEVAERDPRIGLVGGLCLRGDEPSPAGIPRNVWHMNGRELCRRMLLMDCFPVGSPTAVLYRAEIVRARAPFFALGRYHEDTEAAYEILLDHDFGFVHQVCSFLRNDNVSIMSVARRFQPMPLDHLMMLNLYGRKVLTPEEFARQWASEWRAYRGFLGAQLLSGRGDDFWNYHLKGVRSMGLTLKTADLLFPAFKQFVRLVLNPLDTAQNKLPEMMRQRGR